MNVVGMILDFLLVFLERLYELDITGKTFPSRDDELGFMIDMMISWHNLFS